MSDDAENDDGQTQVFFDGDCPMCRAFVASVDERSDAEFRDFRSEELPETISQQAAEGAIHLIAKSGATIKGAKAVLQLLETHRRFGALAKLLQAPPFIWIASLLYPLVALNRFVLFGSYPRLFWCKIAVVLGFLIPMPITRNLWFGEHARFYPLVPIHEALPGIPFPIDYAVFTALIIALLLIAALPDPRKIILGFVLLATTYSLFDQSRWMPYYVEFAIMLLAMFFFPWNERRSDQELQARERQVLNTLGIVLIGIWFWSGAHKLSAKYLFVGFPWMLEPFVGGLSADMKAIIYAGAFLSPIVESGAPICLLFAKTRKIGVFLLTAMHLFILLIFGPLGHNWNHSVWSWNVVHIVLIWLIFWRTPGLNGRSIVLNKGILHAVAAVWFCLTPVLNFFTNWDDFFSHALYSWTTREAEIELKTDRVRGELPEELQSSIETLDGREIVHILRWSFSVFESPPYHSERVYRKVFSKICGAIQHPEDLQLVMFDKPHWLTGVSPQRRLSCKEIAKE